MIIKVFSSGNITWFVFRNVTFTATEIVESKSGLDGPVKNKLQ